MTILNEVENQLQITIQSTAPAEERVSISKALIAAIRWNAQCSHKYDNDAENLYVLAELLQELNNYQINQKP